MNNNNEEPPPQIADVSDDMVVAIMDDERLGIVPEWPRFDDMQAPGVPVVEVVKTMQEIRAERRLAEKEAKKIRAELRLVRLGIAGANPQQQQEVQRQARAPRVARARPEQIVHPQMTLPSILAFPIGKVVSCVVFIRKVISYVVFIV
jgi:hypothetical protein